MEIEIYDAFKSIGIADDKAKTAVESIGRALDIRHSAQQEQMATKADLAEAKTEIIKWNVGTILAATALAAAMVKLFGA